MTAESSTLLAALLRKMQTFEGVASKEFLRTLSKPQLFFLSLLLLRYEYVLHRLYQRWDSSHKLNVKPKLKSRLDPFVKQWERLYDITIQLHAEPGHVVPYSSGTTWLMKVFWEDLQWQVRSIPYWDSEQEANEGGSSGKRKVTQDIQKGILSPLRNYQNPFDHAEVPHLAYTIDRAILLTKNEDFRKKYWRPFVLAFSNWIRAQDREDYHQLLIEGDKIQVRQRKYKDTPEKIRLEAPNWVDRLYAELHCSPTPTPIILLPSKYGC